MVILEREGGGGGREKERRKSRAREKGRGSPARSRLRFLERPEGVGSRDIATELINARRERFLRRSPPRFPSIWGKK